MAALIIYTNYQCMGGDCELQRTEGKTLMPASLKAITNGEAEALEELRLSNGLLEGTRRPMMNTPPM